MTHTGEYRFISNVSEEGFEFYLVLQYVAHFYTNIMKGQIRHDSPDTLIKYSRDWEYPWVLIKSKARPNYRILDCGSGYSPPPFIWSKFGAEVHAIDNDAMVCSRFTYLLHCLPMIASDMFRFMSLVLRKMKEKKSKNIGGSNEFDVNIQRADSHRTNLIVKGFRLLYSYLAKMYRVRISKIWRPDFWGPVSPRLLRAYGVNYRKGDLTNLPYRDGYFDVVSCVSVLEHLPYKYQSQGIREMSRVVKKGGKLIITYDKYEEDLTDRFVQESNMTPIEIVYFSKPNLYNKNMPDTIGICLVK